MIMEKFIAAFKTLLEIAKADPADKQEIRRLKGELAAQSEEIGALKAQCPTAGELDQMAALMADFTKTTTPEPEPEPEESTEPGAGSGETEDGAAPAGGEADSTAPQPNGPDDPIQPPTTESPPGAGNAPPPVE